MSYFSCDKDRLQCVPWLYVCDKDPECNDEIDESHDLCKSRGKCGGKLTTPNGILTSPSYPNNYPDNADCVYTISQPTGTVIVLTFQSMNIEYESTCDFDYLEIRDGNSGDSPLLGKLCGSDIPAPIQSSHNHVWMK